MTGRRGAAPCAAPSGAKRSGAGPCRISSKETSRCNSLHALVATALLGLSPALAADGDELQGHPALRPGLDRHHLDQRHRQHAPHRARLRARGQDPLGADRLRGDEEGRDRRLPRQLDAGPAALPRRPRRRQGRRGDRPEPRGRQVHPRRPDRRGDRARRRRLQGPRRPRRRLRREDLRHRDRRAGQPEPAEDDRRRRLRPRQVDAGRIRRAGDARAGHPRREVAARPSSSSPGRRTR